MKIFNKYTYLFLGLIVVAAIVIINFIPNLETEEFDQQVIDNIIEGVTTTTEPTQNENEEVVSSDNATTSPLSCVHSYCKLSLFKSSGS